MRIVTHNQRFHTDDLLGVAALLLKYPDAEVVRSRDDEVINAADIVVDVGLTYDKEKNRFDHHQPSGAGKHSNDVPYASFGLVWEKFGEEIAGGKDEAKIIEDKLVIPIDAIDNGVSISTPLFSHVRDYSLGDYFRSFTEHAQTVEEYDKAFNQVLPIAIDVLKREIAIAQHSVSDWKEVRRIYNESEDKKIIVLTEDLSWQPVLIPTDAHFVIRPRVGNTWGARAVPKESHSFELKKPFPTSWAGLRDEMLASVSGVKGALFCHRDRYMCVAKTKEGAIKLAEIALNA